jgi:hypothetical protein
MQVAAAESGSALVNLSGGPPSLLPTLLDWREADVQEVVVVPGPTGGSDHGRLVLDVVVQSLPPLAGCMFRFASRNEAGESEFSRPSNVVRTLGTAADAPWYGQTRTRSLSPRAGIEYKQPTMSLFAVRGLRAVEAAASHVSLAWELPLSTGGYPSTMLLYVGRP